MRRTRNTPTTVDPPPSRPRADEPLLYLVRLLARQAAREAVLSRPPENPAPADEQ
jgi:hypothetical protein